MRSPLSSCARGSKASCRRSSRRTPSIRRGCWRARWGRVGGSWSACRAVGTRTWTRSKSPRSPRLRRDFAEAPVMVAEATRLERALKVSGDLTLVAYIMAGHPNKKKSIEVGKKLAASGIAAIEIGIPHSDPLADGPVIQRAGQVALEHGMTVAGALEVAGAVAREGMPVVLMTYINPVLSYDPRRFAAEAAQAGVAGVIVPDLPIEEAEPVVGWLRAASLDTIFMVAPTTPPDRVAAICGHSSGF